MHAAHRDNGRRPVDDDRKTDRIGGREAPAVWVRSEGRILAHEGNDLCERCGAVRVGDVAALGGLHYVTAAPEVVECIIDGDLTDAVFVCECDTLVDGFVGSRLAELLIRVPDLTGFELRIELFDFGRRNAAAGGAAE